MNPRNFVSELKRRNVYKVAVAYAVVAWLLIQAASLTSVSARGHRAEDYGARLTPTIIRTITPVRVPTAEATMGSAASVSRSRFGTVATRLLNQRVFGVTGPQRAHGGPVNEVTSTPITRLHLLHADALSLPAGAVSARAAGAANAHRARNEPECELEDTSVLCDGRYFNIELGSGSSIWTTFASV